MKNLFLLLALCCLPFLSQAQINKTLHYTFSVPEGAHIDLDLDGEIKVSERGGSRILIELNISMENGNKELIDNWIKTGRYELAMEEDGDNRRIYPVNPKTVAIRKDIDVKVIENLTYIVYLPHDMNIVSQELKEKLAKPAEKKTAKKEEKKPEEKKPVSDDPWENYINDNN